MSDLNPRQAHLSPVGDGVIREPSVIVTATAAVGLVALLERVPQLGTKLHAALVRDVRIPDGAVEVFEQASADTLRQLIALRDRRVSGNAGSSEGQPAPGQAPSAHRQLTPTEVSTMIGLSERRVRQLADEGALAGRKAPNGRWSFTPVAVRRFLDEQAAS